MRELDLPEEITASRLRGEDSDAVVEVLDYVLTIVKNRQHHLVAKGLARWDGPRTVVVIVPSSEVFNDHRAIELAQVLARIGRSSGVSLRLIDATPPLPGALDGQGAPVYSLAAMGSTILREFAAAPDIETVTFHQVSPREMVELAENA